jgi:hypothetical protein
MSASVIGGGGPGVVVPVGSLVEYSAAIGAFSWTSAGSGFVTSSWQQLTAATSQRLLLAQLAGQVSSEVIGTVASADTPWVAFVDVGVGAAASEVVMATVFAGGLYKSGSHDNCIAVANACPPVMVDVPSGSRIAARFRIQDVFSPRLMQAFGYAAVHLIDPLVIQ